MSDPYERPDYLPPAGLSQPYGPQYSSWLAGRGDRPLYDPLAPADPMEDPTGGLLGDEPDPTPPTLPVAYAPTPQPVLEPDPAPYSGYPQPSYTPAGANPQVGADGPWSGRYAGPLDAAPPMHPSAVVVLILGVASLILPVLGPVAWKAGNDGLRDYDWQPGRWSGRQSLVIGKILGVVSSLFLLAPMVVGIALAVFLVVVT